MSASPTSWGIPCGNLANIRISAATLPDSGVKLNISRFEKLFGTN